MKCNIRTANLERSMNQTFYKTDFVAKWCKNIIWCKKSNRRFFSIHFLTRTPKNGKN